MATSASLAMLQFLGWIAERPRSYAEVMDAWRSSCPRLSVWEDAMIEGLVKFHDGSRGAVVLTGLGRATLARAAATDSGSVPANEPEPPLASGLQAVILQPSDEDVS
jgi:hypothetical protein